ncbi:SRPBCC family protein [Rhodococcus sp. IEGM 1408]|uniref:SRPBCC family protein n=1 Tax=Rhodococcus sp. IEGM 1408 TaxID=3082220 RepID=UPI0029556C92|nr:SRPBCC family protein [Rhodococcus sp. IEGM 1408]MDV8001694.1 SRPBCC family protein [Rhodococcus sp. IEGM 1408]
MPVTSVDKDLEKLTMTIVADFPVPVRRLWDAYVDPRQLEKFWGPVEWPATFTRHDVFPGGRSEYYMTGPDGSRAGGYWEFLSVDEGASFEVLDGFTGADGTPDPDMPTMRAVFEFEESGSGSRLRTATYFNSLDELEQLLTMGIEEGTRSAMSQIDDVLADLTSFAADRATEAQLLSDTQVRFSRVLRGTPQQVWDAHHDPELLRRWNHGPDGWSLVGCDLASAPGETNRFVWAPDEGTDGESFALSGELLSTDPPHREVFTETMEGADAPPTHNVQTLTPVEGGTLMSLVVTYDSLELRDLILGTGMVYGMEAGYKRLESEVLTRS